MSNVKHLQVPLPLPEYGELKEVAEREKKSLKEALLEAVEEWVAHHRRWDRNDPLFRLQGSIPDLGGSDRLDEVVGAHPDEAIRAVRKASR